MSSAQSNGTRLIDHDIWLEPYRGKLEWRQHLYEESKSRLIGAYGSLKKASLGHRYFGFNRGKVKGKTGVWYREWAPEALSLALVGDFNDWKRHADPLKKDDFGVWSKFFSDDEYGDRLVHDSKVKVSVATKHGIIDRIPAYIQKVIQEEDTSFCGIFWMPENAFQFKQKSPKIPKALRIYECHVGMAQEEAKVGSYDEFRKNILPRIEKQGYNAIQIMGVAQHPYYGSFGYQVSNFFAVSHFMGDPDELKALVDEAHKRGLVVLMDIVHSHTVKNIHEGLNRFDGSEYQYFHAGARGNHPGWDTKLFNYGKTEVLRFLLSNLRFWLEDFNFDGFRFDGVTSMLYKDHGITVEFDHYDRYFDENVDEDAIIYFKLANELLHALKKDGVSIAEDVSGLPGLARPVTEGGLGFDYRLAMGIPDYWIKILKHYSDEDWPMDGIFQTLLERRRQEKHIAYAESHDQAMVGDKTIAFRLMDSEMYHNMTTAWEHEVVSRGIALHKLIRMVTFSVGGEGWLNFMGNEFGHPEWIDFPREGNGYSFQYARRQWSLVDNPLLRYQHLNNFDRAMQKLDTEYSLLADDLIEHLWHHQDNKILIFRRGSLVFIFNFDPKNSQDGLRVPVPDQSDYRVVLSSDEKQFGGFSRVKAGQTYPWQDVAIHGRRQSIQVYLPARTMQVLAPV